MNVDYGDVRLPERFWVNVYPEPNTGCWLWGSYCSDTGYGSFSIRNRTHNAHRLTGKLKYGELPKKVELDHLCRVRRCVNPDHLDPVSRQVNAIRGLGGLNNWIKTHCPQGHPYDGVNTAWYEGRRNCRTCIRTKWAKYEANPVRVAERTQEARVREARRRELGLPPPPLTKPNCIHGHAYNDHGYVNSKGVWCCRECKNASSRRLWVTATPEQRAAARANTKAWQARQKMKEQNS